MKLSEYLKEKSMGNVKTQEKEVSIEELEGQIEAAKRKIKLETQKRKALKKKEEIEKILANPESVESVGPKIAYGVIIVLILIILGGLGYYFLKGDITGATVVTENKTETQPAIKETESVVYDLGDKIKFGNLSIMAENVNGRDKVGKTVGNKFAGISAEGIFYIVKLNIENEGKKSVKFKPELLIVDSEEREYVADENVESYYVDGKILDLDEEVKPLLVREGVKIFDVPKQATGLKLLVKDGEESVKINLESAGKIKVTTVSDKPSVSNEPGPNVKVSLTDTLGNKLSDDFTINGTDTFNYIYHLENLEKNELRCNVDEEVNGVLTTDHQVLKLAHFEKEEFPEAITKKESVNYTVKYATRCRFEGKLGETKNEIGFTAQFIN